MALVLALAAALGEGSPLLSAGVCAAGSTPNPPGVSRGQKRRCEKREEEEGGMQRELSVVDFTGAMLFYWCKLPVYCWNQWHRHLILPI